MTREEDPELSRRVILPVVRVDEIDAKVLGLAPLVSCAPGDLQGTLPL